MAGLTALGAVLRFTTLDWKSLWRDEAYTVLLVRLDLGTMLEALPRAEDNPPLYYLLAWLWAQVLGTGEVGLRSLSALLGAATIPVAYLAGREVASRRAGVAAAGLVAVNPLLVWYSQEARSYALLILLGGLSFLYFLRALHHGGRPAFVGWALTSSLALATHWFAFFMVGAQAAWLLAAAVAPRRRVLAACAVVAAVSLALVPLLLAQRGDGAGEWIAGISLLWRVVQLPGIFLVGFEAPAPVVLAVVAAAAAAVGSWSLMRRSTREERRGALVAGGLAALATAAPLALALAGLDVFLYRNLLAAAVPLAVFLGAGFGAERAGAVNALAAGVLVTLSLGVLLATAAEPKYHRDQWRALADALGPTGADRAIVMAPAYGHRPLAAYMPGTGVMPPGSAAVGEVVLLALPEEKGAALAPPRVPRPLDPVPAPAPGFAQVERHDAELFTLIRFRAPRAVRLREAELARRGVEGRHASVLLQPRAASR